MANKDLSIFRCPHCAPKGEGTLASVKENWLGCVDCGRKYPIVKDIPVLMPEEGDKWMTATADALPDVDYYDRFVNA